jgi:hypothetical protein|tara:strand:- start:241 stop:579 length:339 start_codon:yes stop_codon:yes gene_type:complete
MKTALIAGAIALTSTGAFAQDVAKPLTIDGDIAYSVEKKMFDVEVGPTTSLMGLTIAPRAHMTLDTDMDYNFTGVSTKATYGLSSNLDLYGKINASKNFKYEDITIGVAFSF